MDEDVTSEGRQALYKLRQLREQHEEQTTFLTNAILGGAHTPQEVAQLKRANYQDPTPVLCDVILEMKQRLLAPSPVAVVEIAPHLSDMEHDALATFIARFIGYQERMLNIRFPTEKLYDMIYDYLKEEGYAKPKPS